MARQSITDDEEGKRVVNAAGDQIGIVSTVKSGTAYVDPAPELADKIMATLGWDDIDEDDYPLDPSKIDTITDDEIRLSRNL